MTRHFIAALTLVLMCQPVRGDFFHHFTQIDAQPRLGRLAIHRGVVTSGKHVNWMCEHREELAKEGIFPDADPGELLETRQEWVIDGQVIEVLISSNFLLDRVGPGTALAENHMQVRIDGVLRFDTVLGESRWLRACSVTQVVIQPGYNLVTIQAHRDVYTPELHRHAGYSLHFFYGPEWGKNGEEVLCDSAWLDARIEGEHHEEQPREVPGPVLKPVPVNARAAGE